jgi:hypothetical protein
MAAFLKNVTMTTRDKAALAEAVLSDNRIRVSTQAGCVIPVTMAI